MSKQGAKRTGRKDEKRWLCWRARSQSTKAESRAIETRERQAGKREINDQREGS